MKKILFPVVALAAFGAVACSDANTVFAPELGGVLFSHSVENLAPTAVVFGDVNIRAEASQVRHSVSSVRTYADKYEFKLCTESGCGVPKETDEISGDRDVKVSYVFTDLNPDVYHVQVRGFVPGATSPGEWTEWALSGEVEILAQQDSKLEQSIDFTVQQSAYLNEVITLSATATSGLSVSFTASGSCSLAVDGVTLSLTDVGTDACTVTASQAGDDVWYAAVDVNRNISVIFRVIRSGFLEPLTRDRIFRAGSTLPVKFQLRDFNDVIVYNGSATISVVRVHGTNGETAEVETITGRADSGNAFRYSTEGEKYIFNLGTARTWSGTYRITAALNDGTSIQQDVQIQR